MQYYSMPFYANLHSGSTAPRNAMREDYGASDILAGVMEPVSNNKNKLFHVSHFLQIQQLGIKTAIALRQL